MLKKLKQNLDGARGLWFQISVCVACVLFFILDIAHDLSISAELTSHFYFESLFALLLTAVLVAQVSQLLHLKRARKELLERLEHSNVDLHQVIEQRFEAWNLSPSEHEVATLIFKGFSASDIAHIRGTAQGTIKAQMSGIYRKAEVKSIGELMMLVIDDLADQKSQLTRETDVSNV